MPSGTKRVTVFDPSDDTQEFEFMLEVDWRLSRFIPGRYSGPPDQCYPDEGGELEIEEIRIYEFGRCYQLNLEEAEEVGVDFDRMQEDVTEECSEPDEPDFDEPDPDYDYDSRFDGES